ncbi:transcription initiation factor TFIID subunit 2 isoform X1 [Dendrobium catenatum]|nr:transcription initiation factor TFIID subunit 2 isoform X1 [Dendrobium catenatum]XP_020679174.1 transcription initiation factor TFIID subunit 2 isoform X1 [Dendrobium catenatum]XP_020679175.1 transcription initiation factor TFIID subunit 2 isoform X1 [Dendrobium catenatum]XP_020679176.1 transcription initiation factor TFIID subunit 2 isoform X1 [Dendrobium catenatum]
MAKPRKQKSDEQKHLNSGGVVLHQKLCISVDMENSRVYGHTEMKVVVPESGVIALHADNMIINKITVDGKDAEFECVPHYQFADDESSWSSVSCSKSAADAACSSYISSLNRETSPNLIITCCNKSKEPQSSMGLNVPENIIQSSCAEQVVNGCNEHSQDKDVKVICIDYWLDQTETGIHFGERLLHTDNQIRRVHCWFPCMYTFSQHCLFDLEFTVSSNFVAVSNGDLLYQVLSNDDPPRKTFIYKLNVPVSAAWISLAVAPFEVLPDNHIGIVSHMCLASDLQKLQNTVGFFHNAFRHYEDYLSTSFPFGSYKQVFIPPEISISSVNMGASMCLFSSKLLFDEKVIDQTIETRIKLAYALARQWFGVYIIAEEPNDEWLLEGLAGFLTDSFIKGFLGNNEARYRRYKDNCAVCKADTCGATALYSAAACSNLYGTQTIGVYGRIRLWKAVSVLQMLEKQMGPDSFRKILQVIVERAPDPCHLTRALSTKEFRHLANKVGNLERPFLKDFFPRWIESCGCPVLRMGFSYNKRRNMVELAVLRGCTVKVGSNENQDSDTGWPGMMSIRIHELDGMYDHPILPMAGEACQLLEIQCHSKLAAKRILKPKKGSKADGSDDNTDTVPSQDMRTSMDSPLLWIRVDPEMEFLADVHFHQPIHMWINQLEKEKDVVAQAQAIEALKNLPEHSFAVVNALNNFLSDSKAFWRVRIDAAYALAHTASEESDWAGLVHLIKFYKSRRYDADIGLPRPNDFHDVPEYFVLEAIPHAVALVRSADNKSPREAVEFLLQLLKYNDNNGNPYSDVYWLISLVRSIGELEFSQLSMSFLPSLLKCIDRLLQFDSLMPSYDGILTINCLHTLVRVALKMSTTIPIDHVFELIKPFRNVKRSSWKIRIEANKALLDLEYYCKGLDAAICLFTKFMLEEPSLPGQTKLAVHLMQLCQINSESENGNAVSCATLVALLRLLASRKAFNNVFLRHHLFCIIQIVAGRAPTLYGFTKVKINQVAAMESNGEQPARSASFKLKITRTQEMLTDTPNNSVDAPSVPGATKDGDTVSNRSEGRMNILKIRVKQPASSSKADGIDQLPGKSRGALNETELGHSSSVSVDAPPMKGAFDVPCTSNQNIEEVSSSCDQESRVTASIVSRKLANKDEAGKDLQCTANTSNTRGEGLSPSSSRKDEGMFIQRISGDQNVAISKPEDVPAFTDYLEGKRKRKKEKKDKGSRKKHGDKDGGDKHRFEDPEYLEQKRLKKERKHMVKMVARMQEDESRTSASESLDNRKLCKSRDLNNLEESDVHAPNPTKSASDSLQISKGTKIKIRIRNQGVGS